MKTIRRSERHRCCWLECGAAAGRAGTIETQRRRQLQGIRKYKRQGESQSKSQSIRLRADNGMPGTQGLRTTVIRDIVTSLLGLKRIP